MAARAPLLQLLNENLKDAVALGLIDHSAPEVATFSAECETNWDATPTAVAQKNCFDTRLLVAISELDRAYRPIQAFRGKTIRIVHVRLFQSFVSWVPKITGRMDRIGFARISALDGMNPGNVDEAVRACLTLTQDHGVGATKGRLFTASEILPSTRAFWVSRRVPPGATQEAQFWRDRLGLIHLADASSPVVGKGLVRVEFQVELSKTPLSRTDPKRHLVREERGVWLVRPTMVHRGNHRFVQRHKFDVRSSAPRVHGRTRDLASLSFDAAERELLLVYGASAKIRFRAVEMLNGFPAEVPGRDNSDSTFVAAISRERGWSPP